jgi:hypothetical protein
MDQFVRRAAGKADNLSKSAQAELVAQKDLAIALPTTIALTPTAKPASPLLNELYFVH